MLKKKLIISALGLGLATSANASTFHQAGSTLGYGAAGNTHTLFNNFQNPAALGGDTSKRLWGVGLSVGVSAEYADMSGIDDDTEQIQNQIDQVANDIANGVYDSTAEAEQALETALNNYFSSFTKLSMNVEAGASLPIVIQTSELGGYLVGMSVTRGARVGMIQTQDADVTVNYNPITQSGSADATTNANLTITGYELTEFTLGYGLNLDRFVTLQEGKLNAGARLKMMRAGFNHFAYNLDEIFNDVDKDFGDELSDEIKDTMTFNNTDSAIGIDLGAQFIADRYLVGLTLENINSPSFNYTAINSAATSLIASNHLDKSIKLDPKARLDFAYFTENRRWTLAGFADLNKTTALSGLKTQQAGISASFASSLWYAPDVRLGYTNEAAGNKLSQIHGGLTVGPVSFDLAFNSLDFKEFDDNSVALNLSLELKF
ncbi:conjugal transfer protein TraF [Thiomicrospira microaerophila]|uniref:conjugal transfer protein TraF n=1 Tax=Thiomicrospira microaerophila TaxID=406020 RepID=UPI00200CB82F|nr:conjugal transfer protein TraF [Thiomicrospira microaerophila]UQB41718.1 conjugal transfer protein TraF [Thiomicrospira microaerophila]